MAIPVRLFGSTLSGVLCARVVIHLLFDKRESCCFSGAGGGAFSKSQGHPVCELQARRVRPRLQGVWVTLPRFVVQGNRWYSLRVLDDGLNGEMPIVQFSNT